MTTVVGIIARAFFHQLPPVKRRVFKTVTSLGRALVLFVQTFVKVNPSVPPSVLFLWIVASTPVNAPVTSLANNNV